MYSHSGIIFGAVLALLLVLCRLKLNGVVMYSKSYTTKIREDDVTHYATAGELFGRLPLGSSLSEDTVTGRILLQNVQFLLITASSRLHPDKVMWRLLTL